jgi:hypothetical protein
MEVLSISPASLINRSELKPRHGFWRRQFDAERTHPQLVFDVIFGIILPLLCFIFDPVVFHSNRLVGKTWLSSYQLFAYAVAGLEMATLLAWLSFGERLRAWCGGLGGVLMAGGFFSFVIGLVLLPLSIIGLIILIGILGFTPFLTSLVYLRNGWRALHRQDERTGDISFTAAILLGAALALGVPATFHWSMTRMLTRDLRAVLAGDERWAESAAHRLRYMRWLGAETFDEIALRYAKEPDLAHKRRLANLYQEITGTNVETRLSILAD